jgi:hypothetical protein
MILLKFSKDAARFTEYQGGYVRFAHPWNAFTAGVVSLADLPVSMPRRFSPRPHAGKPSPWSAMILVFSGTPAPQVGSPAGGLGQFQSAIVLQFSAAVTRDLAGFGTARKGRALRRGDVALSALRGAPRRRNLVRLGAVSARLLRAVYPRAGRSADP